MFIYLEKKKGWGTLVNDVPHAGSDGLFSRSRKELSKVVKVCYFHIFVDGVKVSFYLCVFLIRLLEDFVHHGLPQPDMFYLYIGGRGAQGNALTVHSRMELQAGFLLVAGSGPPGPPGHLASGKSLIKAICLSATC